MTEEQKKVMRTQDIKYVEMKRVAEVKVTFNFQIINHACRRRRGEKHTIPQN